MNMKAHTAIEAAAAEFGRHTKAGVGWALGQAVAACVQPGTANGRPPRNPNDRQGFGKVSEGEFARRSSTSAPRVARYLDAWKLAAAQGIVAHPDDLTPDDWNDPDHLPEGYNWSDFYAVPAEDAGTRATPGNIGRQLALSPELAEAAARGLAAGAIHHVEKQTNRDLSRAVDEKIVTDYGPPKDRKPRPRPTDELDDAYWTAVRKALHLVVDAQMKCAAGAEPPADVSMLMQIVVPRRDWDDALQELIGDVR